MAFIVVFDDRDSIYVPMTRDEECDGALHCAGPEDSLALFDSRPLARKSIQISRAFAQLCKLQGKPFNDDFIGGYGCVRIVKAE